MQIRTQYGHDRSSFGGLVRPLILLAAPQGFEPRYADPESAVLPLNEGAAIALRGCALQERSFDCMAAPLERQSSAVADQVY